MQYHNSMKYLENLFNSKRLTNIGMRNLVDRFLACKSGSDIIDLANYYRSVIPD